MTHVLPWFLPGAFISVIVGLLVAPTVARALHTGRGPAWLLVSGLGIVLAATLTPLGVDSEVPARVCDFSRLGIAPIGEFLVIDDASLNVALFIPLGIALGLLTGSGRKWIVVAGAILLPFVIETLQLLAPALSRGCQSADVVDNLTGLVVGMIAATVARWVYAALGGRGLIRRSQP